MAIESLPHSYNLKIREEDKRREKEIPGCHIEKQGKRVLVTIPATKESKEKILVFSSDEIRRLMQDIYVGD